MADDDGKPMLDYDKLQLGIRRLCDLFDELDLTLPERWWVSYRVAVAAAGLLGMKMSELAEIAEGKPPQGSTQ